MLGAFLLMFLILCAEPQTKDGEPEEPKASTKPNPQPAEIVDNKRRPNEKRRRFEVSTGSIYRLDDNESISEFTDGANKLIDPPAPKPNPLGKLLSRQLEREMDAATRKEIEDLFPERRRKEGAGARLQVEGTKPDDLKNIGFDFRVIASLAVSHHGGFKLNRPFRSAAIQFPHVYTLDREGGLYWFKLGEPGNQADTVLRTYFQDNVGDGNDLIIMGETLACTAGGRVDLYSLHDPMQPRWLTTIESDGPDRGPTRLISSSESLLAINSRSIVTYAVPASGEFKYLARLPLKGRTNGACIAGQYLYVSMTEDKAGESGKLCIFDLSEPKAINEVASVPLAGSLYHLLPVEPDGLVALYEGDGKAVMVDRNFTSQGNPGFAQLFDLKDPRNPTVTGTPKPVHPRSASSWSKQPDFFATDGHVYQRVGIELKPVFDFDLGSILDGAPYMGHSDRQFNCIVTDSTITVLEIIELAP